MKLKPSLDVESIEDFKKYYEGAYVRTRDNKVWRIREVAVRTKQIVLQLGKDAEFEELTIVTWDHIINTMRFGRCFPGMFVWGDTLCYISDANDRAFTRGLRLREVGIQKLSVGNNRHFNSVSEGSAAWYALLTDYLINPSPEQIWESARKGECIVINRLMGCGPRNETSAGVFVRQTMVAALDIKTGVITMLDPAWVTVYGLLLTKIFKQEVLGGPVPKFKVPKVNDGLPSHQILREWVAAAQIEFGEAEFNPRTFNINTGSTRVR